MYVIMYICTNNNTILVPPNPMQAPIPLRQNTVLGSPSVPASQPAGRALHLMCGTFPLRPRKCICCALPPRAAAAIVHAPLTHLFFSYLMYSIFIYVQPSPRMRACVRMCASIANNQQESRIITDRAISRFVQRFAAGLAADSLPVHPDKPPTSNQRARQSSKCSQSSPSVNWPASQPLHLALLGQLKMGACL